jgi:TolB-like protein
LLGLPLVLFFAWAFEMTPEGLKLEKHVDRSQSITSQTGRKLDFVIIGVLVVAVGFLLVDKFYLTESTDYSDEIVATESQSIAVLPFVNISDDKDHFADGLSEELLNLLAKVPDLKVAARTSSFAFKGFNQDMREVGDALGVKTVLEGSVRRSGERLRVTAQLINVDDGFHIWSETYDRQMADIFDIQDEVANAITDALKLHLTPGTDRPTDSPEAYALYLEALAQLNSEQPYQDLIDLLDRAIFIDPQFAKAYELKAAVYWSVAAYNLETSEAQLLIYESAARAYELDPSLVLAKSFATTAHPDTWSWSADFEAAKEAYRAEPDNVQILDFWTYDLNIAGYHKDALPVAQRIIDLDPLSQIGYQRTAQAYWALGNRADSYATLEKLRDAGYEELAATLLAYSYITAGEYDEGIAALGDWSVDGMNGQALEVFIENATEAESGLEFLRAWVDEVDSNADNFFDKMYAKVWYLRFGYLDDYWREIEENSPEKQSTWSSMETLEYIGQQSRDSGFKKHPSYIPHQTEYGMVNLWDKHGAPDHCSKTDGQWACE